MLPIKIFIGTSANHEDAEAEMVLEYTLEKNSTQPLDIQFMRQSKDPDSVWYGWQTERWSTPFSGFRWAIPELCNFEGRAIYMDVDMLNLRDISELANMEFEPGKALAARAGKRFGGTEFCVIVFDNARMRDELVPIHRMKNNPDYHHRMIGKFTNSDLVQRFDPRWNNHDGDGLDKKDIWHLHFTNMSTQPWVPSWYTGVREHHPRRDLVDLWLTTLAEAKKRGYAPNTFYEKFGEYNIIGK